MYAGVMARMIRKQIYIEPEQERRLKERARKLDVSEAELIRRGIEEILSEPSEDDERVTAWEKELEFIRDRAKLKVPQSGRTWTRVELYDERLDRFGPRRY
jgi:hypothetical protein